MLRLQLRLRFPHESTIDLKPSHASRPLPKVHRRLPCNREHIHTKKVSPAFLSGTPSSLYLGADVQKKLVREPRYVFRCEGNWR